MQFSTQDIDRMRTCEVYGNDGDKLGKTGQVWLDDTTGEPEWITVSTGLLGGKESFVPLSSAQWTDNGLAVPFTKDQVTGAASIEPDEDHLSEEAEAELYRHYGLMGSGESFAGSGEQYAAGTDSGQQYATSDTGTWDRGTSRAGTSDSATSEAGRFDTGTAADEAMTRSEERLSVSTERVPTGRARLRKYVVTEERQVTVPVSHEEVRIEREPIDEANIDEAMAGPDISESEHEVTLTEERPVVTTEAVPVERVRLTKDVVAGEETVQGQVRKEEIELQEDNS